MGARRRGYDGRPLPPHLAADLARRRDGVETGNEIEAFHRQVLDAWLTGDLHQPAERARRFEDAVADRDWRPNVVPLDGFDVERRDDHELLSVALLLDLATDEPDHLAWRTFGSVRPAAPDPSVFAAWLADHAKDLPTDWMFLNVMFALRSREAAPVVTKAFAGADVWRCGDFLAFFVATGDAARADELIARLTRVVEAALAPTAAADAASSARHDVERAHEAAVEAGDAGKAFAQRLDALLARLPKRK